MELHEHIKDMGVRMMTAQGEQASEGTFYCKWCKKDYSNNDYGRGFYRDVPGEKLYARTREHYDICIYCEDQIDEDIPDYEPGDREAEESGEA